MSSTSIEGKPVAGPYSARVIGTIIVLAIIILIGKACNGADEPESAGVVAMTDSATTEMSAPAKESLKVTLPNGVELHAFKGGIEDELVSFLNNPSSVAGKNVWFDFDNLNFKLGSSEITEESMMQVSNIDAILKAYPKLKIKIGGYTDKTGDSVANLKLSTDRADAVVTALRNGGGSVAQVTGAEGYGSAYAKAAADAPDEKRKSDRRISVSVRAK